jgi:hypothetical protein
MPITALEFARLLVPTLQLTAHSSSPTLMTAQKDVYLFALSLLVYMDLTPQINAWPTVLHILMGIMTLDYAYKLVFLVSLSTTN